jgi:hypothetical protein
MGYYTDCFLSLEIKLRSTPLYVKEVLDYLFSFSDKTELRLIKIENILNNELVKHAFFECPRWTNIGGSDYSKFHNYIISGDRLFILNEFEIKNYNKEIEKFIDWVFIFLSNPLDSIIGYYQGEDDEKEILIFKTDKAKEVK